MGASNVIFINSNLEDFKNVTKIEFKSLKANRLSVNIDKIQFFPFIPKNSPEIDLDFRYVNKLISQGYGT